MGALFSVVSSIIGLALLLWFLADFFSGLVQSFTRYRITRLTIIMALALLFLHFHFIVDILE